MNFCLDMPVVDAIPQVPKQDYVTVKVPLPKQNGSAKVYSKQLELKGKVYKLMIQIDKIRAKPGPKCKKPALLAASRRAKISDVRGIVGALTEDKKEGKVRSRKPEMNTQNRCPVCKLYFDSLLELFDHHEVVHFVCELCAIPFASKSACDEHLTCHKPLVEDAMMPYMCHLCKKTYDCPRNLKVHIKGRHWQKLDRGWELSSEEVQGVIESLFYECQICDVNLVDDGSYRSHMTGHKMAVDPAIPKPPQKMSELKANEQHNLKLTCTVCNQTFDTPTIAENHTCVIKPNEFSGVRLIPKPVMNINEPPSQRLTGHLSRTHHCAICKKVYVNRTTLNNHMKIHEK